MSRLLLVLSALSVVALVVAAGDQQNSTAPRLPAPRLVTLRHDKIPLSKALAALANETGVGVEDALGEPDPTIPLDLRRATFWQALDAIADAAGAVPSLYSSDGRLRLVKRPVGYRRPPVSYDGLFRVALRRVVAARDLDADKGTCTLTFEVAWVPNLFPLFLETQPQGLRLLDDKMKPVAVPAGGSSLGDAEGRTSLTFDVTVPALPRSAQRIGLLEGRLSAVAPNKMLTFRFDNLERLAKAPAASAARRKTEEGTRCRIEKVTLARDRWSVRVSVEMPEGSKHLESFQATAWLANNAMWLTSGDGKKRLLSSSYVLESCTARRAVLTYHFADSAKRKRGRAGDWGLMYRTPALIVDIPIAFRFRDVPLP